jgi:hypothetical protein
MISKTDKLDENRSTTEAIHNYKITKLGRQVISRPKFLYRFSRFLFGQGLVNG